MKYDVVVIGGGSSGCRAAKANAAKGRSVCVVSAGLTLQATKPESEGRVYADLYELRKMGVAVLRGDTVLSGSWDGAKLLEVHTSNGLTLQADEFILATGRFFSKGLVSTMDTVFEPVLGADVDFPSDREKWFNADFFAPQPFEQIGVRTTADGHIFIKGEAAENVKAVGKILGGGRHAKK
jgi:anaerobic glycerol-3-phosphate dehydrogenase